MLRSDPQSALLFTAPHGIGLYRDNHEPHKPENWTNDLAIAFAQATQGSFAVWSVPECAKSERLKKTCPLNRDPNYVTDAEVLSTPFAMIIADHVRRCKEVCAHQHKLCSSLCCLARRLYRKPVRIMRLVVSN